MLRSCCVFLCILDEFFCDQRLCNLEAHVRQGITGDAVGNPEHFITATETVHEEFPAQTCGLLKALISFDLFAALLDLFFGGLFFNLGLCRRPPPPPPPPPRLGPANLGLSEQRPRPPLFLLLLLLLLLPRLLLLIIVGEQAHLAALLLLGAASALS